MNKPVRRKIEYLVLRALIGILYILPYRLGLCLAWTVAFVWHRVIRFRVDLAHERIREVLGQDIPESEVKRIAWRSWRNLCFNVVELAMGDRIDVPWIQRHVKFDPDLPPRRWIQEKNTGIILATMHFGNWDLAGVTANRLGLPVFSIARRQSNPYTDAVLNRMRAGAGGVILYSDDPNVVRKVVKRIRGGEALAVLPDVRLNAEGLKIPFLGGTANVAAGIAAMASLAQCPIFPAINRRVGWTRFEHHILDPIFPNPDCPREEEILRILTHIMAEFTEWVRRYPDQYFWFNKRWVLQPYPEPQGKTQ